MNTGELIRLRLDQEKEDALIKYVKSRRYQFMMFLYLTLAYTVLVAWFAFADLERAFDGTARYSYEVAEDLWMLALRRRRYYPGSLFASWLGAALLFVFLFLTGVGRVFGPGSDYHCLCKQKYAFGYMILGGKKHDTGKHPYYVCDREGNEYICPVFLDYKKSNFGDEMFCVVLDNGRRYAMIDCEKPWWEME